MWMGWGNSEYGILCENPLDSTHLQDGDRNRRITFKTDRLKIDFELVKRIEPAHVTSVVLLIINTESSVPLKVKAKDKFVALLN
jgi:hypothetical protein